MQKWNLFKWENIPWYISLRKICRKYWGETRTNEMGSNIVKAIFLYHSECVTKVTS